MKLVRWAVALGAAVLLGACLPVTSKLPIGASAGFQPDAALYGVWRGQDKDHDAPGFMVFAKNEDGTMTVIITSPGKDHEDGSWQQFTIKTATLGGHTFMNAREVLDNGKEPDDSLVGQEIPILYRLEGKTLTLSLLDDKKTAEAIKAGAIAGTIEPGENGDVRITADAPTLDAFIQTKAGLSLFAEPLMVMKRLD